MKKVIDIGNLLPMYATRKYTNEELDLIISTFVEDTIQNEEIPWKVIGKAALGITFDSCYSTSEKRYVSAKLRTISNDLRNEEINNGNYQEFIDGVERLLDSSDLLGKPKETLLTQMINKLWMLDPIAISNILSVLRAEYPWYKWEKWEI